jgi:hypothetical protein
LVAQYRDKPIEQRSRIPGADCLANSFSFERFTSVIDKRRRASKVANPQDQLGRMIECCAVFCPWARVWELGGARVHRGQIIATSSLGIAVAVDVPPGGLDRPGGGGKDEEASCLLTESIFACFPAI